MGETRKEWIMNPDNIDNCEECPFAITKEYTEGSAYLPCISNECLLKFLSSIRKRLLERGHSEDGVDDASVRILVDLYRFKLSIGKEEENVEKEG